MYLFIWTDDRYIIISRYIKYEIYMLEMVIILILYEMGTLSFGIVLSDNETLFVLAEKFEDVDEEVLMLLWAVMISLCHADMRSPRYLSWNGSFDGADIRPITEELNSYIHALPTP